VRIVHCGRGEKCCNVYHQNATDAPLPCRYPDPTQQYTTVTTDALRVSDIIQHSPFVIYQYFSHLQPKNLNYKLNWGYVNDKLNCLPLKLFWQIEKHQLSNLGSPCCKPNRHPMNHLLKLLRLSWKFLSYALSYSLQRSVNKQQTLFFGRWLCYCCQFSSVCPHKNIIYNN
jgi:hypothetical protein